MKIVNGVRNEIGWNEEIDMTKSKDDKIKARGVESLNIFLFTVGKIIKEII